MAFQLSPLDSIGFWHLFEQLFSTYFAHALTDTPSPEQAPRPGRIWALALQDLDSVRASGPLECVVRGPVSGIQVQTSPTRPR